MTEAEKLEAIVEIAVDYGETDGAHHKQYALDQIIRIALGPEVYAAWSEENKYSWETRTP